MPKKAAKKSPSTREQINKAQLAILQQYQEEMSINSQYRDELLKRMFGTDSREAKDVDAACGYPLTVSIDDYWKMYKRGGVGKRVVDLFPKECWKNPPTVYDKQEAVNSPFETAWNELEREFSLFHYLQRLDKLSGIGRFGVMLLGVNDGKALDQPVENVENSYNKKSGKSIKQHELLYVRVFAENRVKIEKTDYETDVNNPRYGFPKFYTIKMGSEKGSYKDVRVHWTRVFHAADERDDDEIFGVPRMEDIYNYLLDLRKISGGAGEMFWNGGFPGLSFELSPNVPANAEIDIDSIKQEMEQYMQGQKRYVASVGLTARSLTVEIADPMPHFLLSMNLIATTKGIPLRILMGSEQAKLASVQDAKTWNGRVSDRQTQYLTPLMIRPFIQRLVMMGILPEPEIPTVHVYWPDLNTPTDQEKADVGLKRTESLVKYVQDGLSVLISPSEFLVSILGIDVEEAQNMIASANEYLDEEDQVDKLLSVLDEEEVPDDTEDTNKPRDIDPEENMSPA